MPHVSLYFSCWKYRPGGVLAVTHNHLGHHLLTVYSLGASPKQLEATFEANLDDMAKLDPATHREDDVIQDEAVKRGEKQVVITHDNWNDTTLLGVKSNYPAYLKFFHKEIESIGGMEAFEKYFLSPAANQGPKEKEDKKGSSDRAPHMMVRFLSGAFHPWIHIGFGLEFRDRVTLAEGFAQAAVHPSSLMAPLFPETWPIIPSAKGHARRRSSQTIDTDASFIDPRRTHISASNMMGVSSNSSTMVPLTFSTSVTTGYRHLAHPSLLELYAEVCESKEITMPAYDPESSVNQRLKEAHRHGNAEAIRKIADKWGLTEGELVKCGESDGWARRVEELQVLCTLLAVGTGRKGMKTKVDFFLASIPPLILPFFNDPLMFLQPRLPTDAHLDVIHLFTLILDPPDRTSPTRPLEILPLRRFPPRHCPWPTSYRPHHHPRSHRVPVPAKSSAIPTRRQANRQGLVVGSHCWGRGGQHVWQLLDPCGR